MKTVYCDRFNEHQFVPARQLRKLYLLRVATREERLGEQGGAGCTLTDLSLGGAERVPLQLKDFLKRDMRRLNGKKIKASGLHGGSEYLVLGAPDTILYGVFVVPHSKQYTFTYNDAPLAAGTCILWDGEQSRLIGWNGLRKMYAVQPNPVSAGLMRRAATQQNPTSNQSFISLDAQSQTLQTPQAPQIPKTPQAPQATQSQQHSSETEGVGFASALYGLVPSASSHVPASLSSESANKLTATGRLYRDGDLVGLLLSNGLQTKKVSIERCITYAAQGRLSNVKAVTREGSATFLSGNGISLESLPKEQV
jgi:hypothetical protein